MRLFRAAAIVFVVATLLAGVMIVAATRVVAQERTPQWLFEHGHIGETRAVTQKRIAANPRDAVALAWLARTQTMTGDIKGAIANAEKAVAADPNYSGGHLALAEALGEEAENVSVFRQLPMARRIKKSLETAVALDGKNIDALNGLMQFYMLAPGIAGGSNEKADAMAAQIGAVDASRGFIAQANLASRRKQQDKVEGFYLKAFEANRNSLPARMILANFYAGNTAKQAEAEAHAKAALALDPDRVSPYRVLAMVHARAQRWNELDAILAQSDRHHPANLTAMFAAAQVLRSTGSDLPRAERYMRRYLSQPPEIGTASHAVAHWQLGLVLEKAGRRDEARASMQQALRMDPKLDGAKADLKRIGG
jgi:tetratricopeptide (TPR) repeat protein